ncbi:MAG: DNA translocase FtsK 4TM domain-containing protein, partial [Actinomycetota bacterium]|nr:DNA translocase FtsK 4TM domain-containing protein [Actinomycetota bacterium]
MATKTRRAPARRKKKSASRRPRSGAGRPASRKRPASRRRRRPSPIAQAAHWSAAHISGAPAEAWGLLIFFVGIIAALGIYTKGAGPVGGSAEYVFELMVGKVAIVLPVTLLGLGVLVVWPRTREHAGRITAGVIACALAAAGIIHLLKQNRPISAPFDRLERIGGIFGALVARPVSGFLGTWVTGLLLALAFGVGLLIITRTPLSRVGEWVVAATTGTVDFVRGLMAGDDEEEDDYYDDEEEPDVEPWVESGPSRRGRKDADDADVVHLASAGKPQQLAITTGDSKNYKLPSLELLAKGDQREVSARSVEETIRILEATLEQFNVDASVTGFTAGPTVTRLEIELGAGVKVNRVLSLSNEIKYSLASGELRFLAPIPGRSA